MNKNVFSLFLGILMCSAFAKAQSISTVLEKYNNHSVPYISVQELAMNYEDYVVLDTRKIDEFEVSHLPKAIWVGDDFDRKIEVTDSLKTHGSIVVYCTIGVRSEDYGERLKEAGFKNVYNLYGSIFSWKDAGYKVVNNKGQATDSIHTYSKAWKKYLKTGIPVN